MKIAIITDIHHGPQSHTKEPGWDALQVMRDCIWHAGEQGADLILDLGDRISDTNRGQTGRWRQKSSRPSTASTDRAITCSATTTSPT
jgi:hypothetical protein